MTNTLQRLEAAGLIKVEAHAADGRKKLISLTPEGASVHNSAVLAMQPDLESMREAFTDAEFAATLPFLRSLRAWLDENR
jgi:DNA-binding MarR family transcriptional regulator